MVKKMVIVVQTTFFLCLALRGASGLQGNIPRDQLRADWNLLPKVIQQNPRVSFGYNDYFSPKLNLALLHNVEAAHFSADNFFMKYNSLQYEYALEELKYALFVYPNHPKVLMMLESIARLTNQRALPLPYYERALKLFTQHAFTYYQFGQYLLEVGHVNPAIISLERAISIDGTLAAPYACLARAHKKNGRMDLAQESAKKAIELGYKGDILAEIGKKAPLP
jgi:tetratricopeptide (TPR) repeat protein